VDYPGASYHLWMSAWRFNSCLCQWICVKPFVPKFEMVSLVQLLKTITEFICIAWSDCKPFLSLFSVLRVIAAQGLRTARSSSSECCIQGWIEAGALIVTTQNIERSQESARFDGVRVVPNQDVGHEKVVGSSAEETRLKRLFAGFYFSDRSRARSQGTSGLGHYLTSSWRRWLSSDIEMGVKWPRIHAARTENYMFGTRFDRKPFIFL
jgi:hypothetical protein